MDSGMTELGMNERARELADAMVEESAALRVRASTLGNGARVIDAGIETDGGYDAGLALAEICMGGLGDVAFTTAQIGAQSWPAVLVTTDHPAVSCMASQYAGWAISVDKFFAMGSGPAAGARPGGEGAVREARLCRDRRRPACWSSRVGSHRPRRWRPGWRRRRGSSPRSSRS